MNRRHAVRAGIVLGTLSALAYGGCAGSGSSSAPKMSAAEIVSERQRLMKLNGASWSDAQAKFKAGNIEGIAVNAETMAMNAREIPKLFPEGSMTADSKAKPEIWQKWSEFEGDAKNLQVQSEKLRDAARSKNAAATEAIMKDFGRETCGTCHTPFRVPPPRS
jgi:cytochrome c556